MILFIYLFDGRFSPSLPKLRELFPLVKIPVRSGGDIISEDRKDWAVLGWGMHKFSVRLA